MCTFRPGAGKASVSIWSFLQKHLPLIDEGRPPKITAGLKLSIYLKVDIESNAVAPQ